MIRLREHLEESAQPLEEVRDEVIAAIRRNEAMQEAEARAMALLERIEGGASLASLAEETGIELVESDALTRTATEVSGELRNRVFEMPAPGEGEVTREVVQLESGYAVAELREVRSGTLSEEEEVRREAFRRRLANVSASAETQAFLSMLRAQSEIQVFEERLRL